MYERLTFFTLSFCSLAGTFLHRSFSNYTLIGTMGLGELGWESGKVIGEAILSEIGVQKGTDKATGDGSTLVKIEPEVKVAGAIEVAGTVDVTLSEPVKVDLKSVASAITVGIVGGWIVVTLLDTVKGLFTRGGNGDTGGPNVGGRILP